MNQHQAPVDAQVGPLLLRDVKSPEAVVILGGQTQLFQTHPRVDVVNGIQDDLLGNVVKAKSQRSRVQISSASCVRRVLPVINTLRDIVLEFLVSVWTGVTDDIAYKQIFSLFHRQACEEVNNL